MKRLIQFVRLGGLLAAACLAPSVNAAVSYTGNHCTTQVTSSAPTCTFNGTETSGNFVWIAIEWSSTSATLSSVTSTCTTGNWTLLDNPSTGTSGRMAHAYAKVTSTTAACVVTANLSASQSDELFGAEGSGIDATTPIDGSGANHACNAQASPGTGSNAVTSAAKTSTAADWVVGATVNDSGNSPTISLGTGFTGIDSQASGFIGRSEYLIQGAAGSQAVTFTINTNVTMMTCMAQFKPAAAGGSTPPPALMMQGAGD